MIQQLRKGIYINFIARYSNIFIQLIITSILARLLSPEEFGVVALVSVFIIFFNLLGDMGIGPAIIQNKNLDQNDISNIFNFTLLIGVLLAGAFAPSGIIVAKFYGNEAYINIFYFLSLVIFFSIVNIVPQTLLYKDKKFLAIGIINVVSNTISGSIAILLAYIGFGYYALIFQSIISILLNLTFVIIKIKFKFKWQWGFYSVKKIINFSSYQFLFNFVNYFSRNFDNLLIAKVMGSSALGYYDKAYKLMLFPLQNIAYVITSVLHPFLSDFQNDINFIYKTHKKLINILSLIGGFFSVFCFFAAEEIIVILFGINWLESVRTFKILALSLFFQMVSSSSGLIFQSLNKVKLLFVSGIISLIVNISSISIGSKFGDIEYIAVGVLVAFVINFFQVLYLLSRYVFNSSLYSLLNEMRNSVIVVLIMFVALYLLKFDISNVIFSVLIKLFIATISFILGLLVTGQYKTFKMLIIGKIKGK